MMDRRSFLKFTGAAAAALGTGYATGRLLDAPGARHVSLYGFLPDSEQALTSALNAFLESAPPGARGARVVIASDDMHRHTLNGILRRVPFDGTAGGAGILHIRITRLAQSVSADIVAGDSRSAVLRPEKDFNAAYSRLREHLLGERATLLFSAEYREPRMFDGLLGGSTVVIENERGEFERLALSGRRRTLTVPGPLGGTGITVDDGTVHVHSSSCRHALCERAGSASRPGDVLACAPNRVVIRIEQA
jgi:hypothetical protein